MARAKRIIFPTPAKTAAIIKFPTLANTVSVTGSDGTIYYIRTNFRLEDLSSPTLCVVQRNNVCAIQFVHKKGNKIGVSMNSECFKYMPESEVDIRGVCYGKE